MTFPFRYYGVHPQDFVADDEAGLFYEVHFASPPTPHDRLIVARRFETAVADSSVDSDAGPWEWAADWASFFVRARRSDDEPEGVDELRYGDLFDAMGEAFEDIHAAVPLVEVVFAGARARTTPQDGGDWEAWTVAQQRAPSSAPSWARQGSETGLFERTRVALDGVEPREDESFERERQRVRGVERIDPWWAKYEDE